MFLGSCSFLTPSTFCWRSSTSVPKRIQWIQSRVGTWVQRNLDSHPVLSSRRSSIIFFLMFNLFFFEEAAARSVASGEGSQSSGTLPPPRTSSVEHDPFFLFHSFPSPVPAISSSSSKVSSSISDVLDSHPVSGRPIKPRQPRNLCDLPVIVSELRPSVPARDRFSHWITPFSLAQLDLMKEELSLVSIRKINSTLVASLAESTWTSYGAGLLRFTEYCDREGISELRHMPASPFLLSGFVAKFSSSVSGSTIHAWMSGIRAWHVLNNALWNGGEEFVSQVKKGAMKLSPPSCKRPP